jgi:nitroreductase
MRKLSTLLGRIVKVFGLLVEYAGDAWLFLRYNNFSPLEPRDRRLSNKTVIEAHTIEKGLSLPRPRAHFGQHKIRALLAMNKGWAVPADEISRTMLIGALEDYRSAFADQPAPDPELYREMAEFLDKTSVGNARGGVRSIKYPPRELNPSAIEFLNSRFSARDFAPEPLSAESIGSVSDLAMRAPSQCNRQSTRLHVYTERRAITSLLDLQGGGRGFMEVVPTLFVVTSEITAWGGPQQRNQPYVDGGIFTTMLLLSLEAHGFVCCPMNLAVGNIKEREIKRVGSIPSRERLIVMVAAGRAPAAGLRAANSPRRSFEDFCTIHDIENPS